MQLDGMFISNCNNTLHVSDAIDLGRPYWIPHPGSCHTPEAVSAPENGRKKRPKHVEYYCSY